MRDLPVPDVPVPTDIHVIAQAAPHVASLGAILASFVGYIPVIVAVIPAVYYLILIWESKTVQHYIRNCRMRYHGRKILRARRKILIAAARIEAEALLSKARSQAREKITQAAALAKTQAIKEAADMEKQVPPI